MVLGATFAPGRLIWRIETHHLDGFNIEPRRRSVGTFGASFVSVYGFTICCPCGVCFARSAAHRLHEETLPSRRVRTIGTVYVSFYGLFGSSWFLSLDWLMTVRGLFDCCCGDQLFLDDHLRQRLDGGVPCAEHGIPFSTVLIDVFCVYVKFTVAMASASCVVCPMILRLPVRWSAGLACAVCGNLLPKG